MNNLKLLGIRDRERLVIDKNARYNENDDKSKWPQRSLTRNYV